MTGMMAKGDVSGKKITVGKFKRPLAA